MVNKNRFAVYQLRDDDPELDKIKGVPYNDLLRAHIQIDPNNYTQLYMSGLQEGDSVYRIFDRLRKFTPSDFPGEPIATSDILTIIIDEFPTAYYVDGNRLVLISDFYKSPGDNRLICLDNDEYVIEGKNGVWTPVTQLIMKGIPFYEMRNARDIHGMHILVSFDGKVVAENFRTLTQDVADRTGQHLELWQKYYENGEYVRNLADYAGAMVNYSRVDGSRANQDKDYTQEIRQNQVGRASGKTKDEEARAESEEKQKAETEHMSYKERMTRAKQEAEIRAAQRNRTQPEEPSNDDRNINQEVLDHLAQFEKNINKRISKIEQEHTPPKHSIDEELSRDQEF